MYIYSDTDSIHTLLPIEDCKKFCEINDFRLGFWKHESTFTKAKFLRQKAYIEEIDGNLKVTCAGMPKNSSDIVTFENFTNGLKIENVLKFKQVQGGALLKKTEFQIKINDINNAIEKFLNL